MVAYLKANGMSPFPPNLTVTKQSRHPDVKGNGYVPYGIVFDHTGKLVYHHMSGSYHGGNGQEMIEVAKALVEKAPVIYLGEEPFRKVDALAQQVSKGKGLGALDRKIRLQMEAAADDATKAELTRLLELIGAYQMRRLDEAKALEKTQPSKVIPALKALCKESKGTLLADQMEANLKQATESKHLKEAIAIEKGFAKAVKGWEKLKEKKRTDKVRVRLVKKLEKLIDGKDHLPISKTVEAFLADLR